MQKKFLTKFNMFPDENTKQSRNRRKLQHKKSIYEKFTPNITNCENWKSFSFKIWVQILKGFRMTAIFLAAGKVCMGCTLKPHCGSGVFQVCQQVLGWSSDMGTPRSATSWSQARLWHDILMHSMMPRCTRKFFMASDKEKGCPLYYFYST